MASVILQRVISGTSDNRIVLQNSNFARIHSLGTTWNSIRVGVRLIGNNLGSGLVSTPRLAIGLSAGTSNIFLDATTDHWVGMITNSATWSFTAASGGSMARFGNPQIWAAKKVGTTLTLSSNMSTSTIPADATTATRRMFFVDVTKGSPNYSIASFYPDATASAASPDVTVDDFLNTVVLSSPAFTNHTTHGPVNLAVDEGTDGALTAINIAWDRTLPTFEICDVAVVRLS